jgi:hypothetical protein
MSIDYIAAWCQHSGTDPLILFQQTYGNEDGHWLHKKWKEGKSLPMRLNNICAEKYNNRHVNRDKFRVAG